MLLPLTILSALCWLIALLLPWQPWRSREVLEHEAPLASNASTEPYDLSDITVVIPARNEASILPASLQALAVQGSNLHVILVDDRSEDGTAEVARNIAGLNLTVINGEPLPEGWAGKLWALEQGIRRVHTPLTLLLDADIALAPGVITSLQAIHQSQRRSLVSIMAELHMHHWAEKLLLPFFILSFKTIYPFALANSSSKHFASAAGGCILLETRLFIEIGGLQSMRGALIDDCTLAARVKATGAHTWTGLSRYVTCIRPYAGLSEIWNMVARSAYTQLLYSPMILALTTFFLLTLFWLPAFGLFSPDPLTRTLSLAAATGMLIFFLPTLLFYGLNPLWALLLPITASLYLGMTWHSALRYYSGITSQWKGRIYQ